jgi:hypothetical protein
MPTNLNCQPPRILHVSYPAFLSINIYGQTMVFGCDLSLIAVFLVSVQCGLAQDSKTPLRGSTAEIINAAMQNPDAIGEALIPGVDLTQGWPGAAVAGWEKPMFQSRIAGSLTRISYVPPDSVTGVLSHGQADAQ